MCLFWSKGIIQFIYDYNLTTMKYHYYLGSPLLYGNDSKINADMLHTRKLTQKKKKKFQGGGMRISLAGSMITTLKDFNFLTKLVSYQINTRITNGSYL